MKDQPPAPAEKAPEEKEEAPREDAQAAPILPEVAAAPDQAKGQNGGGAPGEDGTNPSADEVCYAQPPLSSEKLFACLWNAC